MVLKSGKESVMIVTKVLAVTFKINVRGSLSGRAMLSGVRFSPPQLITFKLKTYVKKK